MNYVDFLDSEQREAVLADPTPLKVMAGAGSGKTRVIITRIAHLIDTGQMKPGRVFASAFTKSAAEEMSDRVRTLVPAEDLQIGTFHSLCYRFLNNYRGDNGMGRLGVLKPYFQKRLIQDLLDHPSRDYPDALNVEVDVAEVMRWIGSWKNALVHYDDEEIINTAEEVGTSIGIGAAATVYPLYEKYKNLQRKLDFDDMLLMTHDLLATDSGALGQARSAWDSFFIDEAQDTNHAQWEIIKLIAPPENDPNITIVGDTRQCLYRFRGAIPELMDNFEEMYRGARVVDLVKNYRSTIQVVERANNLISSFQMSDQEPVRGDGPEVLTVPFEDEGDQAAQTANLVTALKERDYQGGDIAVLIRTNAQSVEFERAFVMARHPYWCKGGGFFSHREIADVMGYIRLAVDPTDAEALHRIINKPTRYLGKAFVEAVESNAARFDGDLIDAMEVTDRYRNRRLSDSQKYEVEKLVAFLRSLQDGDHTSRSMIESIVEDLKYIDWLKKTEGINDDVDDSRVDNIDALKSAAWNYTNPADLVAFAEMTDKLQMESGDAVEICTVHRAKGREWPVVVASNFYEKSIPHIMAVREGSESDERRVAYVAFTRAQDLLVVAWPRITEKYGETEPSRYLEDAKFDVPSEIVEIPWWGDSLKKIDS